MKRRTFLGYTTSLTATLAGVAAIPQAVSAMAARSSSKPLNILVLGGTNFVGPAIVTEALARGHNVTLFNRGITRPELFPELEKLRGFRGGPSQNLDALRSRRQWDAVIDVWPANGAMVEATARLLADRTAFYFFVSSIAAYQSFREPGMVETAALRAGEEGYGGEKVAAEAIVEDLYKDRFGVARCHAIFGSRDPGSSLHYWLRRLHQHEEIAAPGNGDDPIQFVDVKDVASWTVRAIEQKNSGIHNLVSSTTSFSEFLNLCKNTVNSSAILEWVDGDFIYDQNIRGFDGMPLWFPQEEDPGFFRISAEKAKDAGMRFRPYEDTLADAWRWYQSAFFNDTTFPHNGWGVSREKEEALLGAWRAR